MLACSSARLGQACALTDLGAALRRANRRTEAREPLRRGLDLAVQCHATPLAVRVLVGWVYKPSISRTAPANPTGPVNVGTLKNGSSVCQEQAQLEDLRYQVMSRQVSRTAEPWNQRPTSPLVPL